MNSLNFKLIFSPDGTAKEAVTGWESGEAKGLPYCETTYMDVKISVLFPKNGETYIKIFNGNQEPVVGFWGIEFPWEYKEGNYTLVPALFYNGNEQNFLNPIPLIKLPETPVFNASFSSSSFPAVLYKNGNKATSYVISHKSIAGWNGVELDAEQNTLTFYTPAKEPNIYRFKAFKGFGRKPYSLEPGSILSIRLEQAQFDCENVTDLFDFYFDKTIRTPHYKATNAPKLPEKEGIEIVRDWVYNRHCFFNENGEPMMLNAFTNVENPTPGIVARNVGWNTMIGWCSGSMTALPLLHFGGKYRDFAVKYLDFLATHGDSPSGVKYCVYDGYTWLDREHPKFIPQYYDHVRFYGDYIYYLGKAIRFEQEQGHTHESWNKDFRKGIDILLEIWEREHDFGIYWNLEGEKVDVYHKGTCAGAFALLALAEGLLHFKDDKKLEETFRSACKVYYDRCVVIGRCNGGPCDIREADDSESAGALTDALVQNYKLFETEENLKMALDAAKIFVTWVINYAPRMPEGSMFENISVMGGVIANIQNRHVGPGLCTNSVRFLYDLGKISKDERWIDLYYLVKAAAINCITTYDGEFYDRAHSPFIKGMLSEQINLGDSLGTPGESWRVSASWPATAVLLGYIDDPS